MRIFNVLTIVFLFILIISCDKKVHKVEKVVISQTKNIDSLVFIKDTMIFSNSSEGEELSLFKNKLSNDSIIKSTVYGETGKVDFTFIFNKELLKASRLISKYKEPIYINSTPKIIKKIEENLNTSILKKKELINIFLENVKFFRKKMSLISKKNDSILKNWEGIYYLSPYSIDSGEIGNYYIEIFKDYCDFGFSGSNEFRIKIEIIEEGNKLSLYDKNKYNNELKVGNEIAVITKIKNENYVKSNMIKIIRNDIKQNIYGYMFNWKKTVEEVPDTPE